MPLDQRKQTIKKIKNKKNKIDKKEIKATRLFLAQAVSQSQIVH